HPRCSQDFWRVRVWQPAPANRRNDLVLGQRVSSPDLGKWQYADSFWPKLVCKVAHSAFPGGLDRTHYIVMLNHLLAAIVGQREDSTTARHQWLRKPRHAH